MNLKRKKLNKKGFTILELLVVVAIIAILAAIAIPQFIGSIDKSRVSSQIADCASTGKALIMYNYDTSNFPLATSGPSTASQGFIDPTTPADSSKNILLAAQTPAVTGWNGPYMSTYPATNKWGGGFTYKVSDAALVTASGTGALTVGKVVIELTNVPASQLAKLDEAIDGVAGVGTGVFRISSVTPTTGYYIVK